MLAAIPTKGHHSLFGEADRARGARYPAHGAFYRDRARQVREVAEHCRDPAIKEPLENIARQFEDFVDQWVRNGLR